MKITINPGPEQYTIQLLLEDEEWKIVHFSILGRKPAIKGADRQELEEKFDELEYKGCRRYIIRRLTKRTYHSSELRKILLEKYVNSKTTDKILSEFLQLGYLNDQEWCASFVRSLKRQKYGPRAIAMKLRMKGVDEESASCAIAACCDVDSQKENIQRLLSTRYRSRDLTNPKEKQKVVAALLRKGYGFNEIFNELQKARTL